MPPYFAYGSNMQRTGLRARCPRSRMLGPAILPDHRFFLMRSSGYASIRAAAGEAGLPDSYVAALAALLPPAERGGALASW